MRHLRCDQIIDIAASPAHLFLFHFSSCIPLCGRGIGKSNPLYLFKHTSYLSRAHERGSCKFFLAGVNFYRFNAKNWQFTVYFAVITQKIVNLLCILS